MLKLFRFRKMSELKALCIFLDVRRTSSQPDFFRNKNCFKNHQIKIYFKTRKKSQQYYNQKLSKYRFLTIFGKLGLGKMVLSRFIL